jgi:hypothetical protein
MSYTFSIAHYLSWKMLGMIVMILFLGGATGKVLVAKRRFFLVQWFINLPFYVLKMAFWIVDKTNSVVLTALFIFIVNSLNCFLFFTSGLIPYLPFFFNGWLGFNLGVVFFAPEWLKNEFLGDKSTKENKQEVSEEELEEMAIDAFSLFVMFAAGVIFVLLEFAAVIYAFILGYSLNFVIFQGVQGIITALYKELLPNFAKFSLSCLFIAANLEAYLVQKSKQDS